VHARVSAALQVGEHVVQRALLDDCAALGCWRAWLETGRRLHALCSGAGSEQVSTRVQWWCECMATHTNEYVPASSCARQTVQQPPPAVPTPSCHVEPVKQYTHVLTYLAYTRARMCSPVRQR
jgi:hypothetical protein